MRSTLRHPVGRGEVLSQEECKGAAQRIFDMLSGAKVQVEIGSGVNAGTQFARGDSHLATASGGASVMLRLYRTEGRAVVTTDRLDDEGLRLLVAEAEAAARQWRGEPQEPELLGPQRYQTPPKLFFDELLPLMTPDGRASIMTAALDATEAAGLIGAGDITASCSSRAVLNTEGLVAYRSGTYGEFSMTARTKDGRGSGWAWSGFEDWSRVDPAAVIARAVDLAQRSASPVAVEPGRYTVILEPAAVAEMFRWPWDAQQADAGYTVFSKEPRGTNKIGLQMIDKRLHMVSDPWDPEAPQSTVGTSGNSLEKVQWFQDGVLKTLAYRRSYARQKGREPVAGPGNLRLYATGPLQSLEEMIASTRRGIWVNRLSNVMIMNPRTLLLTGTTRDGTFLIENGKITKAIKNFRFTESPFFVFNKLEAAGEPVRAMGRPLAAVAPRLKVRDFEFSSLTNAI